MFNNSGEKIQLISKIFTFLSSGVCMIIGLIYLFQEDKNDLEFWLGLLLTFVGPFLLYFIGLLLHGFGVIVTNNDGDEFKPSLGRNQHSASSFDQFMGNGFPVNNVREEKKTDDIIQKMKEKGYLNENETEHITENK